MKNSVCFSDGKLRLQHSQEHTMVLRIGGDLPSKGRSFEDRGSEGLSILDIWKAGKGKGTFHKRFSKDKEGKDWFSEISERWVRKGMLNFLKFLFLLIKSL